MSQTTNGLYTKFKTFFKRRVLMTQLEGTFWKEDALYLLQRKNAIKHTPNTVLDIGCGNGQGIILIAKLFNIDFHNVYGIDIDDTSIATCRKIFNVIKTDVERNELPFRDSTFDLVICNQVLEHLKNYRKTMNDTIRVTKKGGYIVFGIPNLSHLINRILLLLGAQPLSIALDGPHIRGFTHKSFIEILNTFDRIEIVDATGTVMYPLPHALAKIASKYFVGLTGFTSYLLRKK
jgi:methionine biosynthesis protein MetW